MICLQTRRIQISLYKGPFVRAIQRYIYLINANLYGSFVVSLLLYIHIQGVGDLLRFVAYMMQRRWDWKKTHIKSGISYKPLTVESHVLDWLHESNNIPRP